MADDWIKIRIDLADDPNVFILSDTLNLECPTVVGHLVMFWGWIGRHTPDGRAIKLTESVIDRKIAVPGFSAALRKIGWLSGEDMALELPNFERHNGDSAKARALESEAKRLRRGIDKQSEKEPEKPVGQVSDISRPESPTREEKRREEKIELQSQNHSVLADGAGERKAQVAQIPKPELVTKRGRKLSGKKLVAFELFWTAFNYKKDRAAAADAWLDLTLDDALFETIIRSAKVTAAMRPSEIAAGKTPIYPQGWLTGRRWEDEAYLPPGNSLGLVDRNSSQLLDDTFRRLTDRTWAQ